MIKLSKIKKLIEKHRKIEYDELISYAKNRKLDIKYHPKPHLTWVTPEQGKQIKEFFIGKSHPEPDFSEHLYIATGKRKRTIIIPMYPDKIDLYPDVPIGSPGYAESQKYGQVVTISANQFGNIDLGHWMKFLAPEPEYSLEYYANFICTTFQTMRRITYDEFVKLEIVSTGEKTEEILAAQRAQMARNISPIDLPKGHDARPKIGISNLEELDDMQRDRF